jgi:hypothetical protein
MRFMILLKSDPSAEAGELPTPELLNEMGKFNAELVNAGVLLAAEGLRPSSTGAKVTKAPDGKVTVVDGPYAEAKELVAGFWILDVSSKEEALEWVRRCPAPFPGHGETVFEVRPVVEAEDFAPVMTPEQVAAEDRLRERISQQHG